MQNSQLQLTGASLIPLIDDKREKIKKGGIDGNETLAGKKKG
jgi:hypothetical protein